MPILGIQWRAFWPTDVVRISRGILELVTWSFGCPVEAQVAVDVGIPSVGLVNLERASVYFIHPEAAVEVGEGRDAGTNPAEGLGIGGGSSGAVVCIVDHHFVFVGVAEKDIGNDVWGVAVDNLIEEVSWIVQRVRAIPAGQHVPDDPDSLLRVFGSLKFLNQEVEHA